MSEVVLNHHLFQLLDNLVEAQGLLLHGDVEGSGLSKPSVDPACVF